ncbi:AarF/ABC1/UbiB kinase family protein [Nocardia veterana]|uniref:AarF/ABC1/UbiB kinase family protein n=1 Tax=Nocardia veterana TaxID=132249 RepID=A0A7X6LYE3_9NOCA|nr:AarF/ABC1/UbiB kinase family protein [Nocardia veterana]
MTRPLPGVEFGQFTWHATRWVSHDGCVSEIVRRSSSRNAKLAKIPLGIAGRAAVGFGRKLAGGDKGEINAELNQKAAEQIFSVLGELKGGAMKFGQALSVMEAAVPEEFGEHYREALTKLQAAAPPLPAAAVHRVLDQQLGTAWRKRFRSFDDTPTASASIGQVHKAEWSDGRTVAVKVQYPGADEALRADLKTLNRMAGMIGAVIPGADVKPILAEITERTEEELDYRTEAANQRRFAKAFDGHPRFLVPKVVAGAPKVIVTEWLDGTAVSGIIKRGEQDPAGTVELRNRVATRMGEFHFSSPALAGLLHADPHPGNFMMLDDGRLAVLDFGACAPLPDGFPPVLGQMVALAVEDRFEELTELMYSNGWVIPGRKVTHAEIADYLRPFTDPIRTDSFHFTRRWMQRVAGKATDMSRPEMKTGMSLQLPAEHIMVFRVLMGSIGICAQLDAEVPFMKLMRDWVPGYTEYRSAS